jgi:dTDP-4-dehydrorhamnose 3,5-epimerase-like enzyme
MTLSRVSDVRSIDLPVHREDDGELVVAEAATGVPFAIARMFTLRAQAGTERGKHAHRLCSQLMLCVQGEINIVCDDGIEQRTFSLDRGNLALLVPPTIWNTVVFTKNDSVLVVLCDRPYEEQDYIRDYLEFLAFRKVVGS